MGAFGEKFRIERERRGFTLDDVSNVTKISARMLKAIEEEHFDQLPGGVFNKGFVRAYAKHLGLDDEESVSEYLVALRQAQVDAQNTAWQPEHSSPGHAPRSVQTKPRSLETKPPVPALIPSGGTQSKPVQSASAEADARSRVIEPKPHAVPATSKLEDSQTDRQPAPQPFATGAESTGAVAASVSAMAWKIAALVLAVSVLVVAIWSWRTRAAGAEGNNPASPAAQNAALSSSASGKATTGAPASSQPSSQNSPATPPPSHSSSSPPSLLAAEKPAAEKQSDAAEETDVSPPSPVTTSRAGARAAKPPALTLAIRATENCWISVTADGQTVSQETLIAPAHTSVRASHEIVVKVGNAAGVSFLLNGREFPARGGESEVKTFVFDGTGMRVAATTPQPDLPR